MLCLAHGLSKDLTGIERVAITHADALSRRGIRVFVTADDDARWPQHLPPDVEVVPLLRTRPALIRSNRRVIAALRPTKIHSWGAFLPMRGCPRSVTVHDWGPFRDVAMSYQSRLTWCLATISNVYSADLVHFFSPELASSAPILISPLIRRKSLISRPLVRIVEPTPATCTLDLPQRFCLFVGTDSDRKRLDFTAAVCAEAGVPLVAAGSGTARLGGAGGLQGLGYVAETTLEELYARCTALIMLSRYEGFGMPALEAAAHGKPLIVSYAVSVTQGLPAALIISDQASISSAAAQLRSFWADFQSVPSHPPAIEESGLVNWLST